MPKFPGPYVNETRENDPIMKRVNQDKLEIGARNSGLPSSIRNSNNIDHVGGTAGSGGK